MGGVVFIRGSTRYLARLKYNPRVSKRIHPRIRRSKVDIDYISLRNTLIPEAEAFAYTAVGMPPPKFSWNLHYSWAQRWNYAFHRAMNTLYKDRYESIKGNEL